MMNQGFGYNEQQHFNSYTDGAYYQQNGYGAGWSQQNKPTSKHYPAQQHTARTNQNSAQNSPAGPYMGKRHHPGTRHNRQYPGAKCNPQQFQGASKYQRAANRGSFSSGAMQRQKARRYPENSNAQSARTSNSEPIGVPQNTGASPNREASKYIQIQGNMFPPPEQHSPPSERRGTRANPFPQTSAPAYKTLSPAGDCHNNPPTSESEFTTSFNSEEVFGNLNTTGASSGDSSVYQFAEPSGNNHDELTQKGVTRKAKRRAATDKKQTQQAGKDNITDISAEETLTEGEKKRREKHEKIEHILHLQHLRDGYMKVRTLLSLCHDFKTPVFGDLPGNKKEKIMMSDLVHLLKNELKVIQLTNHSDGNNKGASWFGSDPVLKSELPGLKQKIDQLRKNANDLKTETKKLGPAIDLRASQSEAADMEKKAKETNLQVEYQRTRLNTASDRLHNERQLHFKAKLQLKEIIKRISKDEIFNTQEQIKKHQKAIDEENSFYCDLQENFRELQTRNENLSQRVQNEEAKICSLRQNLGYIAALNGQILTQQFGEEHYVLPNLGYDVNSGNTFSSHPNGHFVM